MKRLVVLIAALVMMLGTLVGPATAAPPHGEGGHEHGVITPNGCVTIDAVLFHGDTRGLHQGSNASSFNPAGGGPTQGPFHEACL